jgi:hypothetical protein
MARGQIDKKKFTEGVISTVIVESQHLDPERVLNTVSSLISGRDLIVKNGKRAEKKE